MVVSETSLVKNTPEAWPSAEVLGASVGGAWPHSVPGHPQRGRALSQGCCVYSQQQTVLWFCAMLCPQIKRF